MGETGEPPPHPVSHLCQHRKRGVYGCLSCDTVSMSGLLTALPKLRDVCTGEAVPMSLWGGFEPAPFPRACFFFPGPSPLDRKLPVLIAREEGTVVPASASTCIRSHSWETMSTLSRALNLQSPPHGHRASRNRPKGRSTTGPRALEKSQTLVARVSFLEVSRNRSPRGVVKPYERGSLVRIKHPKFIFYVQQLKYFCYPKGWMP